MYSDHVRVSVFNTGEPIPETDIDNIWNKFYKVDKARTREYGGSGIQEYYPRIGGNNH